MLQLGYKGGELYQQTVQLAKEIYHITAVFPDSERAVLVYTLRRLAILFSQDIVTAFNKKGKKQIRAFRLCLEHCIAIDAQLELAIAVNLVPQEQTAEAEQLLDSIYKKLTVLVQKS